MTLIIANNKSKNTIFFFLVKEKLPSQPPQQHLDLCPSKNSINVHKNIQGKLQLIIIGGYWSLGMKYFIFSFFFIILEFILFYDLF
jgi:hypothetical protein